MSDPTVHQPFFRSRQAAFTLMEFVVVLAILTIVAGIVIPRVGSWSGETRYARAASDLKSIKRSVELMYQDVGYYPADQQPGVDPGIAMADMVPSAVRGDWKGPYLESWPTENPWGGLYDYEYWNYAALNFDGVEGNEVLVSLQNSIDATMAQRLDEILDDGDTSTGMARFSGTAFTLFIGEGRRW